MEGNTDPVQDAEGEVADDFQVPEDFGTNADGGVIDETWAQETEKQLAQKYGGDFLKVVYNHEQRRESFFCDVCEAELNTKKIIELHCGGARHQRKVEEMQELKAKGITAPPKKLVRGLVSIVRRKKVVGRVLQRTDTKKNAGPWSEFSDAHMGQGGEVPPGMERSRGPGPRMRFDGPGNFRGLGARFFRGMNPRFGFRPRFDGARPHFDGSRPRFDGARPHFDGSRPRFDGSRPRFDGSRPRFDGPRPHFDGPRPRFDRLRPRFHFRPNGPRFNQFGPDGPEPHQFGPDGPESHQFGPEGPGPHYFDPDEYGQGQCGPDGREGNALGSEGSDPSRWDASGTESKQSSDGASFNEMGSRGPNPNQMCSNEHIGNEIEDKVPGSFDSNDRGPNSRGDNGPNSSGLSNNNASSKKDNQGTLNPSTSDQGDAEGLGADQTSAVEASDEQYSGPPGDESYAPPVKRARMDDEDGKPSAINGKSVSQSEAPGGGSSVYFTADSNIDHKPSSDEPKDFAVPIVVDGESLAAGGSTGILLKKLAGCVIKSEKDAELALTVSNALVSSLREYYIRKEELKTAELLMNAELKLNTLKAMKVGLKLLDEELMKTPSSSATSRRPSTQAPPETSKAAQVTAFPAPPLTRTPAPVPPATFKAAPPTARTVSSNQHGSYSTTTMTQAYVPRTTTLPDFSRPPPSAQPPPSVQPPSCTQPPPSIQPPSCTQPPPSIQPPSCAQPPPMSVRPSGPPPTYGYNTMAPPYMNTPQPPGYGGPSYNYSAPIPHPGTYPQHMSYSTPGGGQYNTGPPYPVPPPISAPGAASAANPGVTNW